MVDQFLISGLVRVTLALILVLLLPGPASPAPLALRVHVPLDRWRPVVVQPRPTLPARLLGPVSAPGHTQGDSGETDADRGDNDAAGGGDEPGPRLKFRGMDLPRRFDAYDLDHSRGVSLTELAAVTDTEITDAKEPFDAADVDGNQILTQKEFTKAPWIFDAGGITVLEAAVGHGTQVEADGDGGAPTEP